MPDVEQIVGGSMLVGGGAGLAIAALKVVEAFLAKMPSREARDQAKADATQRGAQAAADLIELALKASGSSVSQMLGELKALREQCAEQARKIEELTEAHDACERRTLSLEGQLNERGQQLESLARYLQRHGIDVPDLTGARPLIVLQPNLPGVAE